MSTKDVRYPKGYWISVGISMGVGIGVALGIAMHNIGAGIAVGVAIGAAIGASIEERNKGNIRPLTEQEKKRQKWYVLMGLTIPLFLIIAVTLLIFLLAR